MTINKMIWIPVVIGLVAAALMLLAAEAQFLIPLGNDTSIGVGEIFTTLSAAVGGPVATMVTIIVGYSVHFLLNRDLFPNLPSVYILLVDAFCHLCAMLVLALGYYKLVYPRARKTVLLLVGWFLLVGTYYYVILLPLEVLLLNLVDPDFGATYTSFARNFVPEFLGTALITGLIWFAAPARYRHPQWISPKVVPDRNGKLPDE